MSGAGYSTISTVTPRSFSIAAAVDLNASSPACPCSAMRSVAASAVPDSKTSATAVRPPTKNLFTMILPFLFLTAPSSTVEKMYTLTQIAQDLNLAGMHIV